MTKHGKHGKPAWAYDDEQEAWRHYAEPRRFRKKPVEIEAMRYVSQKDQAAVYQWITNNGGRADYSSPDHTVGGAPDPEAIYVFTLEGTMTAEPGDWIIRGVKGEFYPCKPDIFDATYDAAENTHSTLARAFTEHRESGCPNDSPLHFAGIAMVALGATADA